MTEQQAKAQKNGNRRQGFHSRDTESEEDKSLERVLNIGRMATVVKGGRRFSFAGAVVVGDGQGSVGFGYGKAREVPAALEKAFKEARESMEEVALNGNTIPYQVTGIFRSSRVILVPASPGTGVIAGDVVRAVVECAGIKDILTKSVGNSNKVNLAKATLNGLRSLRNKEDFEKLRGVKIELE